MTGRIWLPPLVLLGLMLGNFAATAQSVEPDEAVSSHGAVSQTLDLTPAQRSAIYNAVARQRVHMPATLVQPVVGAPVPASINLDELPDQAGISDPIDLKYAMVADDVVVVDPVSMRVVDVIHGGIRP
jgi:hypothetical protein